VLGGLGEASVYDMSPLTSRRQARTVALSLLLASAAGSAKVATSAELGELEECESALTHLIGVLESKHQLAGTKERYQGTPLAGDYSKCRILNQGRPWPRYAVYRSKDNVTVVVEKRLSEGAEAVLYGPFRSAYRK
jgi:hypothetical protein